MIPIHILHLEDDPNDAELVALHLKSMKLDHELVWVKSEAEYSAALDRGGFDVILADNTGPTFNGSAALDLAKAKRPDVPLIFLSGYATPSNIAEARRSGAADYVLKDQLPLLIPAIQGAVKKK